MYIKSISIVNYKNIAEAEIGFSPKINCLIGNNGAGKTNLLDAVYFLSFCKSFFNPADQQNIKHGESFSMLQGKYSRLDSDEVVACGLAAGQKKQFKRNSKIYTRLADHIGLLPLVMISPSDSELILGGSEERRRFIDSVISQSDHGYLSDLLNYNKALLQRNNLLKQFAPQIDFDPEMLFAWDSRLAEFGTRIHLHRREFITKLIPVFQNYHSLITGGKEQVGLIYQSELYETGFEELLAKRLKRDRLLEYTTSGIHKEDLLFNIGDYPIKRLGSQGQNKSYLIALKLAQFEFIKEMSGLKPILLLDDIFDKLDSNRVEQIINLVAGDQFGQIFITDTNRSHLNEIIKAANADYTIFSVHDGLIERTE